MATVCKKATVSGKVQGVFYRKSCQQQAQIHDVTGYAKNLANGDVEVIASGDSEGVEQLMTWLWQGPPTSRVESVEIVGCDEQVFTQFSVY